MTSHITRFYRCPEEAGEFRAVCTCGWSMRGSLEEIQSRATTHDMDINLPGELPKKVGFVSGLPED